MPAAPLLTEAEVAERLDRLPRWGLDDGRLVTTVKRRDFRRVLDVLLRIADVADEQDHHPDVAIHWDEMRLSLWTHAVGGLTRRDFRLAEAIDPLLGETVGAD